MISFLISIAILVIGYFTCGKFIESVFDVDAECKTPAIRLQDKVDFVPLQTWRIFLIQFLNIAGLGSIFVAIAAVMYGPAVFLWVVLGSIFAGAVHGYFSGMLSRRHDGLSISQVVGIYLGRNVKYMMRFFSAALMIFVGTAFLVVPAKITEGMTGNVWGIGVWVRLILGYYSSYILSAPITLVMTIMFWTYAIRRRVVVRSIKEPIQ